MLWTNHTEKLLGLKEVIVKNVVEQPDKIEIFIELPRKQSTCPYCGHQTDHVHDYRIQKIKDLSAFGRHTVLP